MIVKFVNFDDYIQYKKCSMVIGCIKCDFKCCMEANIPTSICQNHELFEMENLDVSIEDLYNAYEDDVFAKSVVFSGMEPMLQFDDILQCVKYFRENNCEDDFVIYTGYKKNEILYEVEELSKYKNIIIKFGRFIPGQKSHFDNVLGVFLASDNQYAERIS